MDVIFDWYDFVSFDLDLVDESASESGHRGSDAFGPHVHEGLGGDVQAVDGVRSKDVADFTGLAAHRAVSFHPDDGVHDDEVRLDEFV